MRARLAIAAVALLGRVARADDPPPEPVPAPVAAPAVDPAILQRLEELEQRTKELEHQQRVNDATREQVHRLLPLSRYITTFIDLGAFSVSGNGTGIRSDLFHRYYPKYAGHIAGEWVFMGDPLATAINSLGEPADGGASREDSADLIKSGGRPTVLVNSVGVAIGKNVGHGVSIVSLVELLPRPVHDQLDIELAHIDYRPTDQYDFVLSAGKIDSVLGIEYRAQDAPRRIGVTPSLLCRYTCGRPLGVEARLTQGAIGLSAAVTDGDNFQQRFEEDATLTPNKVPTASGHVQYVLPVGQGLELGVSGAIGPQDNQASSELHQWHYGFDAKLRDLHGFDASAEFIQGKQPGETSHEGGILRERCDEAPCLTYKAGYLFVSHRTRSWLTPYARVDFRSAVHKSGADFVYESHTVRATVGAHVEMSSTIVGKVEYSYNREIYGSMQFPDNVVAASIVVSTD